MSSASDVTGLDHGKRMTDEPAVTAIAVHGLLRSGTNALTELLRLNFTPAIPPSGSRDWKHGPLSNEDDDAVQVVITKHPCSWVLSFKVWEELHDRVPMMTLASFLRAPVSHPRLQATWGGVDPIDTWNRATGSWLGGQRNGRKVVHVRFEDMIDDPSRMVVRVGRAVGRYLDKPKLASLVQRADTWPTRKPRPPLDLERYRSEAWRHEIDQESAELLASGIDQSLATRLGYDVSA